MGRLMRWLCRTELFRSIFRHDVPDNPKDRALVMTAHFLLHLHPVKVKRHALRFTYTFGLGGLALGCALILGFTGVMLMFYYVPGPERAYLDMLNLRRGVPFGWLFRNLHRWAAQAMVIFVFLHMCRVFYTAAYKGTRKFNWVIGVLLLLTTLLLSFTGYLLPWDQLSYWAIQVGTGLLAYLPVAGPRLRHLLLGGDTIGAVALLRFYVLHVMVLPSLLAFLMAVHFFRVRKDGGISGPLAPVEETGWGKATLATGKIPLGEFRGFNGDGGYLLLGVVEENPLARGEGEDLVLSFPDLLLRELVAFLALVAGLLLLSIFFDAPLGGPANPSLTPSPAKAPWYFLWLQELLHVLPPVLGGVLIPGAAVLSLLLLPYLDRSPFTHPSQRAVEIRVFTAGAVALLLLILIGAYFRGPGWHWAWPWAR